MSEAGPHAAGGRRSSWGDDSVTFKRQLRFDSYGGAPRSSGPEQGQDQVEVESHDGQPRAAPAAPADRGHVSELDDEVGFVLPKDCMRHRCNYAHVEAPARLSAILESLKSRGLAEKLVYVHAHAAEPYELERAHGPEHIEKLKSASEEEFGASEPDSEAENDATIYSDCHYFDNDTFYNRFSFHAASLAAGGLTDLCRAALIGEVRSGFAAIRPPGHHADRCKVEGFCLVNNVAVAVKSVLASRVGAVQRVAIIDWDVHHGNGTENIFLKDPNVLYASIHRYQDGTFYPRTGPLTQVGEGEGAGRTVNMALPCIGLGDPEYIEFFEKALLPILRNFRADLVVVSAGFDCARGDPLGEMEVSPAGFAHMTRMLMAPDVARDGRVVLALEGGYNLGAVASGATACVEALMGRALPDPDPAPSASPSRHDRDGKRRLALGLLFRSALRDLVRAQRPYWPALREGDKDADDLLGAFSKLSVNSPPKKQQQ